MILKTDVPHEVAEMMCWECGHRWIAVYPEQTPLNHLQCPNCREVGYAFKTGQTINDEHQT